MSPPAGGVPGHVRRRALSAAGIALFAFSLYRLVQGLREPVSFYDEGLPLTNANLLLWGKVPFRDFYSNYPPALFLVLAGLFAMCGPSVAVERGLALGLHVWLAAASGWLSALLVGRRFSWISAALVFAWLLYLKLVAWAWLAGAAMALSFCALALRAPEHPTSRRFLAAGIVLGAVSWFRHDLMLYLCVGAAPLLGAWCVQQARSGALPGAWRRGVAMVAGWLLAVHPFWGDARRAGEPAPDGMDLYVDQVRYVMPARVLPMPSVSRLGAWNGPVCFTSPL